MGSPLVFADHACEEVFLGIGLKCCGRDDHRGSPPAQNRTSGFPAYGSHLGCMTRRVAPRTPLHPWHTRFPRAVSGRVLNETMFSLARALFSPGSAADCSSLFVWFIDSMARSDSSRACASALWLWAFADRPRSLAGRGAPEVSRFSCMLFLSVRGFLDSAGPMA